MSVDIFIADRDWSKTWNIGNASYGVIEPLIEERLENERDAWDAVYSGAGLGVIHLPGIAEGWSREVAIRVAEVLLEVARMVASGEFDLYEYESFERELETREKFERLVALLDEFLEKWDVR